MCRLTLFLSLVIGIFLIFSISCVTKEVPVTEIYYETAYRTETYTTTEDVVVSTKEESINLTPIIEWEDSLTVTKGGYGIGTTYYKGYRIDQNTSEPCKVIIRVNLAAGYIMVFDLTNWGQISRKAGLFLNSLTSKPERVLYAQNIAQSEISFDAKGIDEFAIVANTYNSHIIASVQLICPAHTVEKKIVTKERQIPYQVEKQRTVLQTKQVPFWEAIFH